MSDECLTVTFFRGLSASGKSTLARELAAKTGAIRLNLDALREMAGQPWSQEHEKFIQNQQDQMALAALRSGRSVIVDNTHLVEKGPRRLATRIWEEGLNVNYDLIDVTVSSDECRHRNMVRRNSPTADDSLSVPDHVVVAQADLWAKEVKRGPWTIESIHRGLPEIVPVVPDSSLPEAAIIDLDGTLCNAAGKRGPYDFDLCGGDELHQHVLDFVNGWAGDMDRSKASDRYVLICTGRDAKYRQTCLSWLEDNNVPYDELFMRAEGDVRRDSVIKLQIYNENIRGEYNVTAALDDRLRVCNVWHSLGIPVFRVGDPNATF
jgi:predicted kinase